MPQRFLKPGITTSPKWNSVGWMAQSFYIRILTLVDDFGRFDGHPQILRSYALPLGDPDGQDIPVQTIVSICEQLHAKGLVLFYRINGKEYLQVLNWKENARAASSKFPQFDSHCEQMFAGENKCYPPSSSSSLPVPRSSPSPSPSPSPDSSVASATERAAAAAGLGQGEFFESPENHQAASAEESAAIKTTEPTRRDRGARAQAPPPTQVDFDAWIAELKQNPAYAKYDLVDCLHRARAHYAERGWRFSRKGFLTFLDQRPSLMRLGQASPQEPSDDFVTGSALEQLKNMKL